MRLHSANWFSAGRIIVVTGVLIAFAWPARAQKRLSPEVPDFRADSTLVLVPVTVVDHRGAFVNGLASDVFTLTENGVRQQIRSFSEEDVPVSMGIVLDLSDSMKSVLGTAKESLRALMQDANPKDEAFLSAVSTRPRVYSGFTRDFDEILRRVASEKARGNTALIDTIHASLKRLRSGAHARKALLVISDGMDNHSRCSQEELLRYAVEADAQIYTVAVGAWSQTAKPIELTEERQGLLFLEALAAKTGGISFIVRDQTDIAEATASIGQALRNQYAIGYVPHDKGRDGRWRWIRVKVSGSGMRAYARTGYRGERDVD
jgi:Ca-activated chloride channel family protein